MPRTDHLSLTAHGLNMPSVDHMFNMNSLNASLDRLLAGNPRTLTNRPLMGLWMNFVRLTDKALREYDAARAELATYVARYEDAWALGPYLRAIDHMENCVSATHRAVLNARALRANGFGGRAPQLTERQEQRLRYLRNTVEHTDERLIGNPARPASPVFRPRQPFALRLSNRTMIIGGDVLTYKELVSAISKMYRTIEVIRGPSVRPGDTWVNASLRTETGPREGFAAAPSGAIVMRPSEYTKELGRLIISH